MDVQCRSHTLNKPAIENIALRLPSTLTNQAELRIDLQSCLIQDCDELKLWKEAEYLAQQNVQAARAHLRPRDPALAVALAQLAKEQCRMGSRAEAESSLREALATNVKRPWPGNLHQLEEALSDLADIVLRFHQPKLDDQFLAQLLTPTLERYPETASLLAIRGTFFARRALWKPAAADLVQAIRLEPDNHFFYHALAPVLVAANDLDGYRQLCARILSRFRASTDPSIADRMAKDCLILPSAGVDLAEVSCMADMSITSCAKAWLNIASADSPVLPNG